MKAPTMSHTVELLYPSSAQVRAAFGRRRPACDNWSGLNSTKRASTLTSVRPINAMTAPGKRSRTRPTMTPAKMEKKYQACWGNPEGAGNNARTIATATGAIAFHDQVNARVGAAAAAVDWAGLTARLVVFGSCVSI